MIVCIDTNDELKATLYSRPQLMAHQQVTSQAIKKIYDRTLFSEMDCL